MSRSEQSRSIRELGGEIWGELNPRIDDLGVPWEAEIEIIDLVMGVLARYDGYLIVNDTDLPVEALPHSES
jgi:hypothetical protein